MAKSHKRRHERYDVEQIQGRLAFSLDVDILNLSLSGLAARTSTPLVVGKTYAIRLRHDAENMSISGTVRWCRLAGTRRLRPGEVEPIYEAGIEFEDILSDTGLHLLSLFRREILLELDRRLCGRFKTEEASQAEIATEVAFEVKKISLSGMLVEAETAPRRESVFDMELDLNGVTFCSRGRVADVLPPPGKKPSSRHRIGIEFQEVDADQRKTLERFIEKELSTRQGTP